jgi:hypothetical protein
VDRRGSAGCRARADQRLRRYSGAWRDFWPGDDHACGRTGRQRVDALTVEACEDRKLRWHEPARRIDDLEHVGRGGELAVCSGRRSRQDRLASLSVGVPRPRSATCRALAEPGSRQCVRVRKRRLASSAKGLARSFSGFPRGRCEPTWVTSRAFWRRVYASFSGSGRAPATTNRRASWVRRTNASSRTARVATRCAAATRGGATAS